MKHTPFVPHHAKTCAESVPNLRTFKGGYAFTYSLNERAVATNRMRGFLARMPAA